MINPYERARLQHTVDAFFGAIAEEHKAEAETMYQAFKARLMLELEVARLPLLYTAESGVVLHDVIGYLSDRELSGPKKPKLCVCGRPLDGHEHPELFHP
jgi:hypothetical protein